MIRGLSVIALALALGACAAQLRPAPIAERVSGRGEGAVAEAAGVRIVARAGAWRSWPPALETVVTPVLVTIDNGSDTPIRIRSGDFALVSPDGRRLGARVPFEIDAIVWEPVLGPPVPDYGFLLGRRRFGDPWLFGHPWFAYDPFFFHDLHFSRFRRVPLPTGDMVQMALPERVLAPRERLSGFLYFERVGRDSPRLDFTARLADDRTGEEITSLAIPFVVE